MTGTAIPNLRPMRMGQILDRAIYLYRHNFLSFVGIVAIVQVPVVMLRLVVNMATFRSLEFFDPYFGTTLLSNLIVIVANFILVQGIGTAAMTRAVADSYLGERTAALEAYRRIGRAWPSLLAALFVFGIVILASVVWWIIGVCIGWLTGFGMILYLAYVILPLVAPVIILERQSASQGWRRAWDLARQRFWWVLGFFIVLQMFNLLVVIGPSTLSSLLLTGLLVDMTNDLVTAFTIQTIIQEVVTLTFSLIFLPFQLAATTLVYFDLRIRSEGLDLALQARGAADEVPLVAELISTAPQAMRGSLVTMRELGYFVGLSLIPIGLYFLIAAIIFVTSMAFV